MTPPSTSNLGEGRGANDSKTAAGITFNEINKSIIIFRFLAKLFYYEAARRDSKTAAGVFFY